MTASPSTSDDRALLDTEIRRRTGAGWQIVSQTDQGVQFKRKAQGGPVGLMAGLTLAFLVAGFLFALFWALALLTLIALVVFAVQGREEVAYVSVTELRSRSSALASGKAEKIPLGASATCSNCQGTVRQAATSCKRCGVEFVN